MNARERFFSSIAAASALALALGACVPAPYGTYVRPSYPDPSAVVGRAWCGGQAGPPTRLAFAAPGNVKIEVSSTPAGAQAAGWPVGITVSVPLGVRFGFVEPHVLVAADGGDPGRPVVPEARVRMSASIPADGWIDLARLGPTPAEVARQALARDPAQTIAEVSLGLGVFPGRAPQRVEVRLPAIQTAAGRTELAAQELHAVAVRRTGYQALRTLERARQVAERQAACERDTPGKACADIALYDTQSFELAAGPFTASGRFWNFVAARPEPLRYELRVAARTTERWRFAAPVVEVTDRTTGERRTERFAEMRVSLAYPVPLSAPIEGAAAALDIRLHLPDGARSRYLVRLPAYEIGGARHALAPIELEVRRFDGGLEPFNC